MAHLSMLLLVAAATGCAALQVGVGARAAASVPRAAEASMRGGRSPWETAQIPLGLVSVNPFQNLKQMQDQRVAGANQIVLAPGVCKLPLDEALALLETWKAEIGDDLEKFEARAKSDSQCPTAASGGDLGFFPRGKLSMTFDDIIFEEEIGKVYGPIKSPKGLHLVYIRSCREPTSKAEAGLGLPFGLSDAVNKLSGNEEQKK